MSAPLLPPADPPRARLVARPDDRERLTGNREADPRTALVRGLVEYLDQMRIEALDGRLVQLQRVVDSWAEPEQHAVYPAAVVSTLGSGEYDAARFTPSVSAANRLPLPDGRFLVSACDLVADLQVEVWATDLVERQALVAMLEDAALAPTDFMFGFRLELPYYFNARAEYEVTGLTYADSEGDAIRRYRIARLAVRGTLPVLRVASFPIASNIRLRLEARVDGES